MYYVPLSREVSRSYTATSYLVLRIFHQHSFPSDSSRVCLNVIVEGSPITTSMTGMKMLRDVVGLWQV